LRTVPACCG
jgi:hypothetical protein